MSKMISVAEGFQYSVNIEYDLNNEDKLKNFIPTKATLGLLEEIFLSLRPTSTERARILIGAYGRGKSHIVLTILSLLMKKDLGLFEKLLPKIKSKPELHRVIENFYSSPNKILPVIVNGTATNLNQSFLSALHRTLAKFNLTDILPQTNFQAAIEVLRRWLKDFPKTYSAFEKLIGEPVKIFIGRLENFDTEAYSTFERFYPTLTAGSVFNPFLGFEAVELYENVAKGLEAKGYAGIYVVCDEFSKFLEANIGRTSISDIKMLQDFAEKANRSGSLQMHLLLISHKEISNYIDKLPKEKVDGWRGVSNRFLHVRLNEDFEQTYEIISSVILLEPKLWKNFRLRHVAKFHSLYEIYSASRTFRDVADNLSVVIEGCFPLHPVSTFILPRLSERVAQNERTLFTFLSAEGTTTLPAFLSRNQDDFVLLTPDKIYDYFEPLFRQELYAGEIHKIFLLAGRILNQQDSTTLAAKIIKTIALIYMLEQFELLAPTKEQLSEIFSCNYSATEIARTFEALTEKNFVVYLRQSNNYLKLKQSSCTDIMQKIRDTMESLSTEFSVQKVLNAENLDNVFYPSRYNIEREMTRWFDFRFISGAEILNGRDLDTDFGGDGIIFGVLVDNDSEIDELKNFLLSLSKSKIRCIFVLPKSFIDMREVIKKFSAIKKLKKLAEDDVVLLDEYEVIFEDLQLVIKNFIDGYTQPENFRATYIHNGKFLRMYRKATLSSLMSKICDEVYKRTPIINNEVINKNEITKLAANSRNKIIAALLRQELEPNLGFRGAGQDVSIMRSTLVRTGILVGVDNPQINLRPENDNMRYLLETIENFILETRQNPISFSVLYDRLTSPVGQIGLRSGVIPIYLAAVIHNRRQQITIINRLGVVRTSLDTLIQINSAPENFSIEYLDWNAENENFVASLTEAFRDFIIGAEKNLDACDCVANALVRWFLSLPNYTKEFMSRPCGGKVPDTHIKLRNLLRQNLSSSELLFKKLPKIFSENLTTTATQIIESKKFFDEAKDVLKDFVLNETKKFFSATGNLTNALGDWCASFDKEIFEQLFLDGTDKFLHLIKSADDEKILVEDLAKLTTGLRLEDWNERTLSVYFDRLAQFKTSAENFRCNGDAKQQVIFVDEAGKKIIKCFKTVEISPRGKLLSNQIAAALKSMGQAVSVQEKRQVLVEILRTLC